MKIIVEKSEKRSKSLYVVSVMDGNSIIKTETAKSIKERDDIVFQLAESYGVDDIVIKESEKKQGKKKDEKKPAFSAIPSIPVLDEQEADDFFEANKELVYNRILQAVKEGIEFSRDNIRLFELSGTGVYITSRRSDWINGLYDAIEWYTEANEQYEKCIIAKELIDKLYAEDNNS